MTINEIKKRLYREKPVAKLVARSEKMYSYIAYFSDDVTYDRGLLFQIPVPDMGDAKFGDKMDAHLLIRWLVNNDE